MAMLNWVRVARLKAEAEKIRAAQQALDDPDRRGHIDHARPVTARRAVNPDHRSGPETAPRDPLPDPDRHQAGRAVDPPRNPKAEAAVERLVEKLDQAQAKLTRDSQDGESAPSAGPGPAESESSGPAASRDPETGRFLEGHAKVGGRVAGTPDAFPRNSYRAMKELIAGRIMKAVKDQEGQEVQKSLAEIMADAIFDGMMGKLVLRADEKGVTYANPLYAVKLYQNYMLKARELALKIRDAKKKKKGTGGGIRIVLPSVPADPLLKPGQPPRPLRLLGQDPSKPPSHAEAGGHDGKPRQVSPGKAPPAPAREPKEDLASQMIEDFENPICTFCMGSGWVRDENGIHMIRCDYCEGKGRAPAPDYL